MDKLKEKKWIFYILLALIFFIPLREAPKNIIWLIFVCLCIWFFYKNKNIYFRAYDSIWLVWFLTSFTTTVYASLAYNSPANGWDDIGRFLVFGFLISFLFFDDVKIKYIVWSVVLSLIIGLFESYISIYNYGSTSLELHSVGHVNHSAIYILIALSIVLSYIVAFDLNRIELSVLLLISFIFVLVIIDSNSRAASGLSIVVSFIAGFFFLEKKIGLRKTLLFIFFLILPVFLLLSNSNVYEKHMTWSSHYKNELSPRNKINNLSFEIFKNYPFFGVGHDNYHSFSQKIYAKISDKNERIAQENYLVISHAHNLFYNYLASSGLVGFLGFLFFIMVSFYFLGSNLHLIWDSKDPVFLFSWFAFSFSLLINLSIGLVNTTLHHEHAMLSMLCAGLFFSYLRYKNYSDQEKLVV